MAELWALTAAEISKLFKAKEVSAVEICNDTIEHIEKINPKLTLLLWTPLLRPGKQPPR